MRFALKTTQRLVITPLIIALALCALIAPRPALADVGPDVPTPGGIITPGEKINTIAMKDEKVKMLVKQGTGPFSDSYKFSAATTPESDRYYAHVTATFTMQNLTDQSITQNMLFPFHYRYVDTAYPDSTIKQAVNAQVKINGQDTPITLKTDVPYLDANQRAAIGTFAATLAPKGDTTITVEYDVRGVQPPKRPGVGFQYMMVTGSHWAGNIGSGEVTVEFEGKKIDSKSPFSDVNSFFNVEDGKLVWRFTNLEPTASDDINISFDPRILNTVWPKRQPFITAFSVSNRMTSGAICYDVRARQTCDGMPMYVDPSPINVITAPDLGQENGWYAPLATGAAFSESASFTFDGKYTFDAIQIRGGILYKTPDFTTSGEAINSEHYNTYNRPKNITVTYDDNSTENITLKDEPASLQSVPLTKKASSTIKLTFNDYYDGVGNGYRYFGVGRIYFSGAQKIDAPAATTPAVSLLPFTFSAANWPIYTAVAAGVIVVIGAIVYIVVRRRKHRNALQQPAPADTNATIASEPIEQRPAHEHHTHPNSHKQKK